MEQSFSDLLSDAFSEPCVPSFPDEDLDFEKLNYDEKFEEEKAGNSDENLTTKEDRALHQEATGESAVLSNMETKDVNTAESTDEEQFNDEGVAVSLMSMDRALEEDYTSSDGDSAQEGSVSGEDEAEDEKEDIEAREKLGDLLMSVCCGGEFSHDDKEDRIFAEGQLLSLEGTENPQVRNKEQGESESDEEVSYFGRIPERGNEMMMIKGDGVEVDGRVEEQEDEKQEDSSDSECEGMKVELEDNALTQCFEQEVENPYKGEPVTVTLDFPEISVQNLQDLIAEVDSEEYVEKMKEFSGEEHQEAGESIADYPSDFSSCEYVQEGVKNQESNSQSNVSPQPLDSTSNSKQSMCPGGEVTDTTWMGREKYTDDEGDGYLYSRDLEMYADRFRSFDAAVAENDRGKCENVLSNAAVPGCDDGGETEESDSYSSSDGDDDDDDVQVRRRDEGILDNMCSQDLEYVKKLEDSRFSSVSASAISGWSISDHHSTNNSEDPLDLSRGRDFDVSKTASILSEDLLTTEDTDTAEARLSEVSQHPAADVNSYFVVQREDNKNTSHSYQGSVDDSFFFNTEVKTSEATDLGQLGDDEYEDDRNWEQEQDRIKAFYEFYDDSDGENDRERPIKVQFCTNPLSQVIHYETDSSDRDSLSSSVDREDDLSSAESSEDQKEPDDNLQMIPACDPPQSLPVSMPQSMPESVPEGVPESVPETVPEGMPESVPETVPEGMPESVPESVAESDLSNTHISTRKHKCLGILKKVLKMGLVIGMGLLAYWMATGQPEWLSPPSFF